MDTNPFGPAAIPAAITQAVATKLIPPGHTGVLLVAPTVVNGQLDIKGTIATKIGDIWSIGADVDWHHGGDLGAGITVAASW